MGHGLALGFGEGFALSKTGASALAQPLPVPWWKRKKVSSNALGGNLHVIEKFVGPGIFANADFFSSYALDNFTANAMGDAKAPLPPGYYSTTLGRSEFIVSR